jgi:hypothetical protein
MPLRSGSGSKTISSNIARLIREGYPRDQAAAISYEKAGRATKSGSGKQRKERRSHEAD